MIGTPDEAVLSPLPWTIGDIAKATAFIVAITVGIFGGLWLLRLFLPGSVISPLVMAGAFAAELSMLLSAWLFGVRKYRIGWSALGFRMFNPVQALGLVCLVLFASFAVNGIYVQSLNYFGLDWLRPPPILPDSLTGIWRLLVPLGLASGVAPVVEEAFFRGFVFGALRGRFGFWLGATGSAVLFTMAHLQVSVLIPIFILGFMLAWLYARTKSIWPCITLHFVFNTLSLLAAYSVDVSRSTT